MKFRFFKSKLGIHFHTLKIKQITNTYTMKKTRKQQQQFIHYSLHQVIGCDGVVDSDTDFDVCGVCGGNGTSCRAVRKTYTDNVKYGYHTVATIPRGATNIFIREAEDSKNFIGELYKGNYIKGGYCRENVYVCMVSSN